MKIQTIFDSNKQNTELLGTIIISDTVNSITVDFTYLDTWIAELIENIQNIRNNKETIIEIVEEPDRLIVVNTEKIFITYKQMSVTASSFSEFISALNKAVLDFYKKTENIIISEKNEYMNIIKEYIKTIEE